MLALCAGCGGVVDDPAPGSGSPAGPGSAGTGGIAAEHGMPCNTLHGFATLTEYDGDNYASSAFSFEYASQDAEVTYNEFDVLYEGNWFRVNTVTDDQSTIADLGPIPLSEVPAWAEPGDYPVGRWGEHEAIEAYLNHTYFVHSVDGAGELVSAFTVVGLEPGVKVSIEWIRSTAPDEMIVPTHCGL
jgi:hypothetical protein